MERAAPKQAGCLCCASAKHKHFSAAQLRLQSLALHPHAMVMFPLLLCGLNSGASAVASLWILWSQMFGPESAFDAGCSLIACRNVLTRFGCWLSFHRRHIGIGGSGATWSELRFFFRFGCCTCACWHSGLVPYLIISIFKHVFIILFALTDFVVVVKELLL